MFQKITLIIALIAALTLASCAAMDTIDTIELSDQSFTDWVAKHDKQAKPLNTDSLVFRKFLKHGEENAQILDPGKYVYLNYTMSTLDGTYFVSRDSLIGRLTGSWNKTTHWCEDFMQFYDQNGFFCPGIYNGIKGLRSGDSVRLYISSVAAYSSYLVSNSGYLTSKQGNYNGFPIICDIKIGAINTNPARAAIDIVDKYAAEKWGQTTKDSLKTGIYARVLKSNPTGKEITTDMSVQLYYKQTFPDGFLLGTNSDSIAKAYNRFDNNASYGLISVSTQPGLSNYDSFYPIVLPKHKLGDVLEVVTIPFYTTLGNSGSFSSSPQLLTFQPTVFTIITKVPKS